MDASDGFLFPHLSEDDTREPIFTVAIPSFLTKAFFLFQSKENDENNESSAPFEIGILTISLAYWIELLGMLLVSLSIAAAVGFLLYKTVIEPKHEGTARAYLIGWGFVIPFWVFWPVWLLSVIDLRNAIFRFLIGGIAPIVCTFRTTEAIYGLCPNCVTKSAKDFCFYYATVPIVARTKDDKGSPILCSNAKKWGHLGMFLVLLTLTGLLQSLLTPHQHLNVFGMGLETSDGNEIAWRSTKRYFTWQLYANSALQAMLFQMYLTTYYEALTFAFSVFTGYEAEPAMDNPLLESSSPSEFWGKRWNTMIHTVLKNGVYKPLRKSCGMSRDVSILFTFMASGIFHEWILVLVFCGFGVTASGRRDASSPGYGGAVVFFAWQALLIGCELALGKRVKGFTGALPKPLKTALVVAMGLPLAHFFLEPYATSGFFFQHGAVGLPMVVFVDR